MLSWIVMIGIGHATQQWAPSAEATTSALPAGSTRVAHAYLVQGITLTPDEDAVLDALEQGHPVQQILTGRTQYDVYSLDVDSFDGVDLGSAWQIADQAQSHACMVDGFQVVVPAEDVDLDGGGPLLIATFSCSTPMQHGKNPLLATPAEEVGRDTAGVLGVHGDTGGCCSLGC